MNTYSVIMALKNGEKYVRTALTSIASQSLLPFEIFVIDDNSTDNGMSIVKDFNVNTLKNMGVGQGAALNTGLRRVTTEYVSFLDHDDIWVLEKQSAQIDLLETSPDLDYVYCEVANFDNNGNLKNMGASRVLGACTFRRSFMEKVGLFNEVLIHHSIVEWWGREHAKKGKYEILDFPYLQRLIHGENSTLQDKDSSNSSLLEAVRINVKKNSDS